MNMNKEHTRKQSRTINKLNIFFANKGVEFINLPKLVQSKNFLPKMSSDISKDDICVVTFKLK